jgi:HAD superfamily hydrolase (TIGR01490 family)
LKLALFDLDGTLLEGDTDALWCAFLIDEGVLDRAAFEARNRDVIARYEAGAIEPAEFCAFYASTLAGRTAASWAPLRARFVEQRIALRIGAPARALVARHRDAGDRVVLTTATNRFLTEPIAGLLGIAGDDLVATELEAVDGVFTGRTEGELNMRDGKVSRLRRWLRERRIDERAMDGATFYSDSANDLPLLRAVGQAVAVDPDERLRREAMQAGWPIVSLSSGPPGAASMSRSTSG